jgi:hypothetical protein
MQHQKLEKNYCDEWVMMGEPANIKICLQEGVSYNLQYKDKSQYDLLALPGGKRQFHEHILVEFGIQIWHGL